MHTSDDNRVITARIGHELAERLERVAAEEDRSQSSVVRRALQEHLARRAPVVHVPERKVA